MLYTVKEVKHNAFLRVSQSDLMDPLAWSLREVPDRNTIAFIFDYGKGMLTQKLTVRKLVVGYGASITLQPGGEIIVVGGCQ